jgi:hypothetical protein
MKIEAQSLSRSRSDYRSRVGPAIGSRLECKEKAERLGQPSITCVVAACQKST